jgi:methylenetetrahydrofolate reductase (NADPH)
MMDETKHTLAEALRRPRYEVIPLGGAEEAIVEHVPKSIKLTVTASPKKGIEETLRLAERLSGRGYEVAPHISARLVRDEAHLEDVLGRLRGSGIKDAFVIAGDAAEPAGKFEGAAALLGAARGVDLGAPGVEEAGEVLAHARVGARHEVDFAVEVGGDVSFGVFGLAWEELHPGELLLVRHDED